MKFVGATVCSLMLAAVAFCPATQAQEKSEAEGHGLVKPSDLKWAPLMKSCELAPVSGNPDAEGPFVVRIRCGAGAKIPAHWHPTDENVTVMSGIFMVGMGDKYDAAKLSALPAGGFVAVPKEMRHFALSKTATVVQVHGMGPFKVNWVNPADVQPPDGKPATDGKKATAAKKSS